MGILTTAAVKNYFFSFNFSVLNHWIIFRFDFTRELSTEKVQVQPQRQIKIFKFYCLTFSFSIELSSTVSFSRRIFREKLSKFPHSVLYIIVRFVSTVLLTRLRLSLFSGHFSTEDYLSRKVKKTTRYDKKKTLSFDTKNINLLCNSL